MATEFHYVNFIYRAAWFPVLCAGCLFSCLGLGGFAAQHIFVSKPFWPWKDVWPRFTVINSDEDSRESEQATCGAHPCSVWMAAGGWVLILRDPCFLRLASLHKKGLLSPNVMYTSLCHTSQAGLKAIGSAPFLSRYGVLLHPLPSPRVSVFILTT